MMIPQSFAEWLKTNRERREKLFNRAMLKMWQEPEETDLAAAQRRVAALFGRQDGTFTFTEEQGDNHVTL